MNVNTKALELAGMLKQGLNHPGIPLGADGFPTGELKGPEVMTPVGPFVGYERNMLDADETGLRNFAKLCVRTGTTTITDLASRMDDDAVDVMLRVTNEPNYPVRLMPFRFFMGLSAKELIVAVLAFKKEALTVCAWGRSRSWSMDQFRVFQLACAGLAITTARPTGFGISHRSIYRNCCIWR